MDTFDGGMKRRRTNVLRLDDEMRKEHYLLSPKVVEWMDMARGAAGYAVPYSAETVSDLRDYGRRQALFVSPHIEALLRPDRIELRADFDAEQDEDSSFDVLFTATLFNSAYDIGVQLEGTRISVILYSGLLLKETELAWELLEGEAKPSVAAERHVISGFAELMRGYVKIGEKQNKEELRFLIHQTVFTFARQDLSLKQLPYKS